MIFLQALSLTQMRHLFFQTSTDSSSLFKESMWITSPPHRSVRYSPWCLFFLFFFWGGEGSLSSCTCGRIDFACGFCLQLDLRLLLLRNSILKACCWCFSKRKLQKPRLKNRRKHNQVLLTHYWNPPCSSLWSPSSMLHQLREEKILLHMFAFFLCVFWGWYTKPEKLMQNSSCKDGEEANSECAKLRKAFVFSTRDKKKELWKKKRDTNNSCIYHSIAHIVMPRLWNLSLQQTRNQNQSNEKLEIVAKSLRAVSTTNRKQKNQWNQSLKWLQKAWHLSLQQPETNQSNQSLKFCLQKESLNFVLTTQLETWNQSNQSLKSLPKISSFNFCFNNTTTRNMKSIKSKLEIVAKKFKLQFLFQQHNY